MRPAASHSRTCHPSVAIRDHQGSSGIIRVHHPILAPAIRRTQRGYQRGHQRGYQRGYPIHAPPRPPSRALGPKSAAREGSSSTVRSPARSSAQWAPAYLSREARRRGEHLHARRLGGHQRTVDRPHAKARGKPPRTSQHLTARRSGGGAQHGARLREARARGIDDLIDAEVESHGRLGMLALGDAIGAQQLGGVVLAVRDEDFVSRSNRACGPDL